MERRRSPPDCLVPYRYVGSRLFAEKFRSMKRKTILFRGWDRIAGLREA